MSTFFKRDVRAALAPWLVAHALVLAAYIGGRVVVDHVSRGPHPEQSHQGLFVWDGAWYSDLAAHWYGALPRTAIRFYPLYPGIGRLFGGSRFALVVIANGSALIAVALFHRLLTDDGHDAATVRHGTWLFSLFPSAFVLVLAYAEGLFMAVSIGCVVALRRQHWLTAALLGCAAATCRPFGLLLVLPAAAEVVRARRWSWRPLAAISGPLAGTVVVGALARHVTGSWTAPVHEQNVLRGDFVDPVTRTLRAIGDLFGSQRLDGLHAPFAVMFVALIVIAWRRLPIGYAGYATACIALALSADNLNSFERYGLNAFPIVIALALLTARSRRWQWLTVGASGVLFVALATLAFAGRYVP